MQLVSMCSASLTPPAVFIGYQVQPCLGDHPHVTHSVPKTVPEPLLGLVIGFFHRTNRIAEGVVKDSDLDPQGFCDVVPQRMF